MQENTVWEFSPFNPVVQRCIQGMAMEDLGRQEEALSFFMQGWEEASNGYEQYLAAYFVARQQPALPDQLSWLERSLQFAMQINDPAVVSALPALYSRIAACHAALSDETQATRYTELATNSKDYPADPGPFYHGTKANLGIGDLLTPGGNSNYQADLTMNHIYFTALANGAGFAAALAKGEGLDRVYVVAPTGEFEPDPNLTDKKFPGNPSRSYRSAAPVKIIGEVLDWVRQTPGDLQKFRERLANNTGRIIN